MDTNEERAEAQRAANILCAALVSCYEWVIQNPDSGFDERSVLSSLSLEKIGGVAGTLLSKQADITGILIKSSAPLAAYIPTRAAFLVRQAFVPEWKTVVMAALANQARSLNEQRAEELSAMTLAEEGEQRALAERQRTAETFHHLQQTIAGLKTDVSALRVARDELSAELALSIARTKMLEAAPPSLHTESLDDAPADPETSRA
jgi:hypothetical protein